MTKLGIIENRSAESVIRRKRLALASLSLVVLAVLLFPPPARAAGLTLPPEATEGLTLLYSGQTQKAMDAFHQLAESQPEDPLGYLLQAEARWWQIFCESCEIKYGTLDAWERPRTSADDGYLALADKAVRLAESQIAQRDSAVMQLYAGMGLLLRARLLGLRDDRRGTARAGVRGRAHLLRCLELDPRMADAYTGLGLYNYYVDTLSPIAKLLRVFMGIPGGKKQEGVRQLRIAMQEGVLTRVEARFYLGKNLRNYDRDYFASIETLTPLAAEYPQNPIFQLLLGDTHAKLGHRDPAEAAFRAAGQLTVSDPACARRVRELSLQAIGLLAPAAPAPR
jgi:tetratricopeptide (TPR) repeat protein